MVLHYIEHVRHHQLRVGRYLVCAQLNENANVLLETMVIRFGHIRSHEIVIKELLNQSNLVAV